MSTPVDWVRKFSLIWRSPARAKRGLSLRARHAKKKLLMQLPNVIHAGNRAHCKEVQINGVDCIKKMFANNEVASACMTREIAARDIFDEYPWMVPIVETGDFHITIPMLPKGRRLDQLVAKLPQNERLEIAGQAIQIAFELFLEGYAHRDFHTKNMFWVDGQVRVVDYEVIQPYPVDRLPTFPDSYDLRGTGLESPFETMHMCYESSDPYSLSNTLRVPLEVALEQLQNSLKEKLRTASLTFKKQEKRHICQAKKIYNSIDLPHIKVDSSEAQRNCSLRFETLGIERSDIEGKRLLDLGCNIGGMIFEAQRRRPAESIGVEYDAEKVEAARMIAAFNGLNNVKFLKADIDRLVSEELGEPFGIVFCFAIEAHVKNKQHLFQLLAEVTSEKLFFEGNSSTNIDESIAKLLEAGFQDVQMLGMCDDDIREENNNRPLLVATK